jgi:hypothetical protein
MSSRAFQKCKKSKMHVKLLRLKTHFVKIVTVSKILEVPKFQKKSFRWVLLKNAILPKTHAKKSFLPPPCEERNPNMLVEDLMLIESDSEFCAISASVTLCIDSAQQLDKGKRDPRTKKQETAALALRLFGNGSTCTAPRWLLSSAPESQTACIKGKQKLWRVNMCTR